MNVSLARPYALYGLFLLAPALLLMVARYSRIMRSLARPGTIRTDAVQVRRIRRCFWLRTLFRGAAWVLLVLAYAGLSWGASSVPVQKNGRAVCFVFDISYSMEAQDAPGGMTRLQAAAAYADALLDHLAYTSVSVVLAKGDGVVAVPLTEDSESIRSLLAVLSPSLMTARGSSLGGGIHAAVSTFPPQSAQAASIWLFTDGEETDGSLAAALADAQRYGIPVAIVGFGSEKESTVLAGDGETPVQTALRAGTIRDLVESVRGRMGGGGRFAAPALFYVDSTAPGSARRLLDGLRGGGAGVPELAPGEDDEPSLMYEVRGVERHGLFIALAIICVAASYVFGELHVSRRRSPEAAALALAVLCTGCSGRLGDGVSLLEGRLAWNQRNYHRAVADFLGAEFSAQERGDQSVEQYALLGLAATYLMQEEHESALERFAQIAPDAPVRVRFSMLYDSGIIAYRQGDFPAAASYFRQALLLDGADINAKINLELSLREEEARARAVEQTMTPVAEDREEQSSLEGAIYSIIRENEQQQWKNQQQESASSGLDY